MSVRIQRHPLSTQAAQVLLDRVRSGEWPLGSRLPGETVLAMQLEVGRSTVREAIRQLAGQGLVETRQGAGVFVTALDVHQGWDVVLTRANAAAVIEARVAIEAEAARLAAERRTPADLRRLRRALRVRRETEEPLSAHVDADGAFHRTVVEAAHNEVLLELFDAFVPRVRAAMVDMLRLSPVDPDHDHRAHAGLVDAIADHDATGAGTASRTHLTELKQACA